MNNPTPSTVRRRTRSPGSLRVGVQRLVGRMGTFPFNGRPVACRVLGRDGMLLNIQYRHPDGEVIPDAWIDRESFTPDAPNAEPSDRHE